jgi:hypothetical protein
MLWPSCSQLDPLTQRITTIISDYRVDGNGQTIRLQGHCISRKIICRHAIDILSNLFPALAIVQKTVYPDTTRIRSITPVIKPGAEGSRIAILRDGYGMPNMIAVRLANDVLADLLPISVP